MSTVFSKARRMDPARSIGTAVMLCVLLAGCSADEQGRSEGTAPVVVAGAGFGSAGFQPAHAGTSGQAGAAASRGVASSVAGAGVVPPANAIAGSPATRPPVPPAGMAGVPAPTMTTGAAGATMTSGAAGSGTTAPAAGGDICARWKADRMNLTEPAWNGDAASCKAGDMTPDARATALRLHTLYRFMAGLDPVMMTDDNNRKAQDCALLMTANGMITHTPPMDWKCYTMEGAATANSSSLSGGGAISSVDGYMIDPGNPTTLGHRRWVLSNMLTGVGFGSSGKFSCQYQPAGRPKAGAKPWVAWPPPGQIPIQAFGNTWSSMDSTGWSVQSDSVNLKSAQVTIMAGGMNLPVTVTQLGSGYGSTYAISMIPMGWKAAAGTTYNVNVTGATMPITYDVSVVDCR